MESRCAAGPGQWPPERHFLRGNELPRRCRSRRTGHASLELRTEILDRTAQRLNGSWRMGAEGLAGAKEVDQSQQGVDVFLRALLALQRTEDFHAPRQAVTAWGTPDAGLTGEKL